VSPATTEVGGAWSADNGWVRDRLVAGVKASAEMFLFYMGIDHEWARMGRGAGMGGMRGRWRGGVLFAEGDFWGD